MPTFRKLIDAVDALSALLDVTWKKDDRSGKAASDDLDSADHIVGLGVDKDGAVALLRTVARSKWLRDVRSSTLNKRQARMLATAESALAKALEPTEGQ